VEQVGGKPQVGLPQRRLIAPASEVQSALQVARARLFLLRREKRAAEQAIIQVLRTSPADSAAIGLSMELNYSTGQLFLAAQQLGQQLARNSTRCRALDLGNLGLLHHCLGKHSTALLYLTQALSQAKRESAARTAPSAKPSVAQVASLQYSAGLQLLLTRQFESAADMFQQAS
jgi:tetratricopeptide (TPR) repeat protein